MTAAFDPPTAHERDALRALLVEAKEAIKEAANAVNCSYEQANNEWRNHDILAGKHGERVDAWRKQSRAALARIEAELAK